MSSTPNTEFRDGDDLEFPVITISVSTDDLSEPIHVDLGSVPPFVAVSVLERVISSLKMAVPVPKITFKGIVLVEPINHQEIDFDSFIETLFEEGDDEDGEQ